MGRLVKILSIDGGGTRAIIPASVIVEIEHRTGKPASVLFDLITGTSAGAIVAMGLVVPDSDNKPRHRALDIVELLEHGSAEIFSRSLWHIISSGGNLLDSKYSPEGMVHALNEQYGKIKMSQLLTETLIPTYEIETGTPFFFKRHEAKKDERKDFLAYEAVVASASAPTYFTPFVIESKSGDPAKHYAFIDGGVVANNPAMCAYVEAKTLFPDADEFLVVSLGTGDESASIIYEQANQWGTLSWVVPLLGVLFNGAKDVVDHQMRTLFHSAGDKLNHYYRLETRLSEGKPAIDSTADVDIHLLKILAENLIQDNHKVLDEICDKLLRS